MELLPGLGADRKSKRRLCFFCTRACFQNRSGTAHPMHIVVSDEFPKEVNLRYQIPEPLWKRFKDALDRVWAETAGAEALAAPRPSSEG